MYKTTPEYSHKAFINFALNEEESPQEYLEHWATQQVCALCAAIPLSIETIQRDFSATENTYASEETLRIFKYITDNTEELVARLVVLGYLAIH
jgi:hypothetical protein